MLNHFFSLACTGAMSTHQRIRRVQGGGLRLRIKQAGRYYSDSESGRLTAIEAKRQEAEADVAALLAQIEQDPTFQRLRTLEHSKSKCIKLLRQAREAYEVLDESNVRWRNTVALASPHIVAWTHDDVRVGAGNGVDPARAERIRQSEKGQQEHQRHDHHNHHNHHNHNHNHNHNHQTPEAAHAEEDDGCLLSEQALHVHLANMYALAASLEQAEARMARISLLAQRALQAEGQAHGSEMTSAAQRFAYMLKDLQGKQRDSAELRRAIVARALGTESWVHALLDNLVDQLAV